VAGEEVDQADVLRVDRAMDACRQGDCFLGDHGFIALCRVTTEVGDEEQWLDTPVDGLVLVSQSCDIARTCAQRPVVEVCPLVKVDPEVLEQITSWQRPRYAAVPALRELRLVADLDRTMTVEKAVIAGWKRTQGIHTDAEARDFAQSLARKRLRFAFPNSFNRYVQPLRRRLVEKHGKESPEGEALRALLEIRVHAEPSWEAHQVQLVFFFVRKQNSQMTFGGRPWSDWCDAWMKRLADCGPYKNPEGLVIDYGTMTAAEYLQSDALDLEQLSAGE
jgi:hypothetical protein